MRDVPGGRTPLALDIVKILDAPTTIGPIVRAAVTALRGERLAPSVMGAAAEVARVALAQRSLPGAIRTLLRGIHVIGRRQLLIRPQASDAIGLIDHPMR